MNKLQYLRHYTLQKFGNDLLMAFIPFLNVRTWKTFFYHVKNFDQSLRFTMEKKSNIELAFPDTLLKRNNGLTLPLEVLGNICIAMVCFPSCDVINSEIGRISLIKPFFYMTKYS